MLQVLTGYAIGLYRRRWRYGSYDEVAALGLTAVITTTGLYLLNEHYFSERPIPQSAVLVGGLFGLVLMKRSVTSGDLCSNGSAARPIALRRSS